MGAPSMKRVRVLRGTLAVGRESFGPGNVVSLDAGTVAWLLRKVGPTLRLEVVEADDVQPISTGSEQHEDTTPPNGTENGATGSETHTGEGEDLEEGGGDEEQGGPAASVPAGEVSTSSPAPYTLQALDAQVAAALVAAGWDSVEKLKGATVEELVKVKGIGKSRAQAILDEVRGA